jgi:general secretion pathway protein G
MINAMKEHPGRPVGFTLIEVLVVLVIISILATVVAVNVLNRPAEARISAARVQIKQLQTAVQMYRTDHGRLPTLEQGLEALVARPTLPPAPDTYPEGGYLTSPRVPRDPWKNDYIYLVPGRRGEPFEIISYGADGTPGGEGEAADISSSDL